MQTTTTNPTPPNQYLRKVKTEGTFKKTFKVLGLYFTVSNCRVKKRISCGYSRQGHDGKLIWQEKQRLYKEHNGRCPYCGRKFDFDVMEIHHVLPYARFQDLITDDRNLLLLCHDCWHYDDDDNIVCGDGRKYDGNTHEPVIESNK